MNAQERYQLWLNSPDIDEETKAELRSIANDPQEIEERFYMELEFGTAGLRGILGAGDNRMNIYNVRRATEGLARYLDKTAGEHRAVAIAYDSRHYSDRFAKETACVLAAHGIQVYLYESLRAVPQLSFTVRELKLSAGVVITASHNPPKYNGYKVYGASAGQSGPEEAAAITAEIRGVEGFKTAYMDFQEAIDKLNDDFNLNLPRSRKLTTSQKHELSDNERLRREKDLKRELLESEIESLSEEHRVVFRASITWPFEYGRKLCAEHCDRLGEYIDNLILELDEL